MKVGKLRVAWSVGCGALCLTLIVVCFVLFYRAADLELMRRGGTGLTLVGIYKGQLLLSFEPEVPYRPGWAGQTYHYGIRYNVFSNGSWYMRGPVWIAGTLMVAVGAPLAALPWIRYRYTIRTLLIATTLVAVMLGLIVWLR